MTQRASFPLCWTPVCAVFGGCYCYCYVYVLDELLQLSSKLDAPYNIEHVARTFHVHLSDAVATFQQNIDHFIAAVRHLPNRSYQRNLVGAIGRNQEFIWGNVFFLKLPPFLPFLLRFP